MQIQSFTILPSCQSALIAGRVPVGIGQVSTGKRLGLIGTDRCSQAFYGFVDGLEIAFGKRQIIL